VLHMFDDVVIDAPLIKDYLAEIMAHLCLSFSQSQQVNPARFDDAQGAKLVQVEAPLPSLKFVLDVPEENNFSLSMLNYDILAQIIAKVEILAGSAVSSSLYRSTFPPEYVAGLDSYSAERLNDAALKHKLTLAV